jgi:hypothetical protein
MMFVSSLLCKRDHGFLGWSPRVRLGIHGGTHVDSQKMPDWGGEG